MYIFVWSVVNDHGCAAVEDQEGFEQHVITLELPTKRTKPICTRHCTANGETTGGSQPQKSERISIGGSCTRFTADC
jgi:hypothetical protein